MQSMFRLPWSTEPPVCDKVFNPKSRPVPVVDIALLSKLKRKRTDSPEPAVPANAHIVKKWKTARGEVQPVALDMPTPARTAPDGVIAAAATSTSTTPTDLSPRSRNDSVTVSDMSARAQSSSRVAPVTPAGATPPVAAGNHTSADLKSSADPDASAVTDMDSSHMTPVQQAIEAQFNLEILLKHNELRLIEQELAKAQVALEQLRRCAIIPYPGTEGLHQDVSDGLGPALRPQPGHTEPKDPAPWGVVDGPYARHYAKWLIPDPRFDSVPYTSLYHGSAEGRSTRGSYLDHLPGLKSRTSRTSGNAMKMQYLGDVVAPAPKVDPLLHKRSTDGQWVRLYCHTCKHSNFSNTQGFLNHCRIKHQQVFKSHDQAAIACGIPVDSDEATTVQQTSDAVAAAASVPATPTAGNTTTTTTAPSLAHPLVKSNASKGARALPPRPVPGTLSTNFKPSTGPMSANMLLTPNMTPAGKGTDYFSTPLSAPPQATSGASFLPSPQTPYINTLLSQRGWSGDLKELVAQAREKVDTSMSDWQLESDSPSHSVPPSATSEFASHPMARGSSKKGGMVPASQRPVSHKGQPKLMRPASTHTPAALDFSTPPSLGNSDMRVIPESPVGLSPHGIESNPGLVSDHDDDDDEDDARSVPHLDRDGDFDMDHDVVVEDGSDIEAERRKGLEAFRKPGPSKE